MRIPCPQKNADCRISVGAGCSWHPRIINLYRLPSPNRGKGSLYFFKNGAGRITKRAFFPISNGTFPEAPGQKAFVAPGRTFPVHPPEKKPYKIIAFLSLLWGIKKYDCAFVRFPRRLSRGGGKPSPCKKTIPVHVHSDHEHLSPMVPPCWRPSPITPFLTASGEWRPSWSCCSTFLKEA